MGPPVMLVHGWGGSFASTWEATGFTAILFDADRDVIGVDLLGHGAAPKPHDPDAYADLTARVVDALPDTPVDAIGFSLGALTLLRTAVARPDAFHRIVLAGIGHCSGGRRTRDNALRDRRNRGSGLQRGDRC